MARPTFEEGQALRTELLERIAETGRDPYDYLIACHLYEAFTYLWVTTDEWLPPPREVYDRIRAFLDGTDISGWPFGVGGEN
jgi:hypothetical protein